MDKNKIINFMFDELENSGFIKFNKDKDYHHYLKIEQEKSEELFDYIKANIDSTKIKDSLVPLIENYVDSCRDTSYHAKRLYYYQGFKDGIAFIAK